MTAEYRLEPPAINATTSENWATTTLGARKSSHPLRNGSCRSRTAPTPGRADLTAAASLRSAFAFEEQLKEAKGGRSRGREV